MDLLFQFENQIQDNLFDALLNQSSKAARKVTINTDLLEMQLENKSSSNEGIMDVPDNFQDLFEDNHPKNSDEKKPQEPSQAQEQLRIEKSEENITNQMKDDEKESIFCFRNIQKENKKNTNFPKFLVRLYLKYFKEFQSNPEITQKYFQKISREFISRKTNNYVIADVQKMLGIFQEMKETDCYLSVENRKVLTEILKKTYQNEFIFNNYVARNRNSYCIAAKVFALRCRSRALSSRAQAK